MGSGADVQDSGCCCCAVNWYAVTVVVPTKFVAMGIHLPDSRLLHPVPESLPSDWEERSATWEQLWMCEYVNE